MQYFGGKQRISKQISQYINSILGDDQIFIDMFCGSCNIISKVKGDQRFANDKHKYLVAMLKDASEGREFPEKVTKDDYTFVKNNKDLDPSLTGFVGFGMSFGGKWFGGFTGEVSKNGQDYLKCAKNGLAKKMSNMQNVVFSNLDYKDFNVPDGSLVYCDIPYKGTTPYCKNEVGIFDHEDFYAWCREHTSRGCKIIVSEYDGNQPEDSTVLLKINSGTTNAAWQGSAKKTVEILYTW